MDLPNDPAYNTDPHILDVGDAEPPFSFIGDDDENIPTAEIIDHITNGKHTLDCLEKDGQLVSVITEAERIDDLPEDELEFDGEAALNSDSASDSGSGSDFVEPEGDGPEVSVSLIPTVTQGRSVRIRRQRDLVHLNRFWND